MGVELVLPHSRSGKERKNINESRTVVLLQWKEKNIKWPCFSFTFKVILQYCIAHPYCA